MQVAINIISAFTKDSKGGNAAAVVLEADALSKEQKQALAAKVGLSETAFVSSSKEADFKLDFFTPVRQIAHCGHATIATFAYLKQLGLITGDASSKMTIDGRREIKFKGTDAYMEQKSPRFYSCSQKDEDTLLTALGLPAEEVISPSPLIVNTGNSFAIVETVNEAVLKNISPDFDILAAISEKYKLIGIYVFCKPAEENLDATARMFAPAYGIPEESATGMAAGPLACYLFEFRQRKQSYRVEQGKFMTSPSASLIMIELNVAGGEIASLFAGGSASLICKHTIEI